VTSRLTTIYWVLFNTAIFPYIGKKFVFRTPLNLGLIWERSEKGERHENNFRNKFSAIAL
jgi:hypothetical protein